jgi:GTP cyclohydrolase IA
VDTATATVMGALEGAHLAAVACACDDDEEQSDCIPLLAGDAATAADAMEPAVRALLLGLGEDDRREGLRRTPKRVSKAFRDGTRGTADPPLPTLRFPAPLRP